ncbi:dehydratase [Halosegnis sp.]|uniref:dehydratase n=1 Tax=Halosegnis sp. TaxID=2864959 RepID=UPI0035D4E989
MDLEAGHVETAERTFTPEDVRTFTEVSGDRGDHHLETDEEGRLLVHGLLTATLATEIGGRFTVLARTMEYSFRQPVYTGERIRCVAEFTQVDQREDGRTEVAADLRFHRIDNETPTLVATGSWDGVIE